VSLIPQGDLDAMAAVVTGAASNATMTLIKGPGAPDRTGDPGEGPTLWTGEARGFLARERHDTVNGGQQVTVRLDTFTLLGDTAPVLEAAGPDWEATTVTIVDGRTSTPVTLVFAVTAMESTAHGLLDSVLLTLDEVGV
jgi:hypothetical protein